MSKQNLYQEKRDLIYYYIWNKVITESGGIEPRNVLQQHQVLVTSWHNSPALYLLILLT